MSRDRKCRDLAKGLPGGLSIDSFVEVFKNSCVVRASASDPALHVVEIRNRSMLRYRIAVVAQSHSRALSFVPDNPAWDQSEIHVGDRPESGGAHVRRVVKPLCCQGVSDDEEITISVKYEAIGPRCAGSVDLTLLVDTRA
jgi:hypothetical protein